MILVNLFIKCSITYWPFYFLKFKKLWSLKKMKKKTSFSYNPKIRAGNTGFDTTTRLEIDSILHDTNPTRMLAGQFRVNPKLTRQITGRVRVNSCDPKLTRHNFNIYFYISYSKYSKFWTWIFIYFVILLYLIELVSYYFMFYLL